EYSEIVQYQLKSIFYCIGKNKIPAFIGQITVKVNGPQLMVNFANLLFRFGEYSGIGIKTAMGMGNIKLLERDKK
ncbi:MAG: CRISPR system precrRNA processing endoribonuclease RAMP protein Cas6, partial [Lachnospiraceae bacterium]|nr:CRISPR system precrRNA processing endoribonuclease RAMP protein Cas6 [Lachnospiraceae bacterium]